MPAVIKMKTEEATQPYVVPKRLSSGDPRSNVIVYIRPIYKAYVQNENYRVFRDGTDMEKYPYIIPLTSSQFKAKYELLNADVENLLCDDRDSQQIHSLHCQGRSFTLTLTLKRAGNDILRQGDELQPSECEVIAGRVVALHEVQWAEEHKRHVKRTTIARIFMVTSTSRLFVIDLHPENSLRSQTLTRGTAQEFNFKVQAHRQKFRPSMAASFGVDCRTMYDDKLWEIKGNESHVICLEFAIASVTEKDEHFVQAALQNIGLIASLVATVAISTHFNPPGFQIYAANDGLIAVNTDILIINNGIFTAFITLNAAALFSALASLFLAVVPQAWYVSSHGKRILDGPDVVALPLSMQESHAGITAPVERYRALCTTLQFSLFFLVLSLFTFASALFVSGFLALFDNKLTMAFFICTGFLILVLLLLTFLLAWWRFMKSSIKAWAKEIGTATSICRISLHDLAKNNKDARLKEILELMDRGLLLVDIDQRDDHGSTPLHIAAKKGCLEVLRLLCQNQASLEARDDTGRTPLYCAAKENQVDSVRYLLEQKANPNAGNNQDGMTPLNRACQGGHVACVRLLLDDPQTVVAQADSHGSTCLHWAVGGATEMINVEGCKECFQLVMDKMGGPNSVGALKKASPRGFTANDLWIKENVVLWWCLY